MQMKLMTTLALVGVTLLPDMADARSAGNCAAIDAVISANEEFVESVLDGNTTRRASSRKEMEKELAALQKVMSPEVTSQSRAAIDELDAALASGNDEAAMLAAMRNYAVLVQHFKSRLATGLDVAMLDHAGSSLLALTSHAGTDWDHVKNLQSALAADVTALSPHLGTGPLADLLVHGRDSIDAAIAAKNPAWLAASALILLDAVDLVEGVVVNKAATACR
jgi:hypothetical protein